MNRATTLRTDSGYRYAYARKLRKAMLSGDFAVISTEPYLNEKQQPGVEYICDYRGRRFYCSESATPTPSSVTQFVKALDDQRDISITVPLIWPNRRGEPGLYLEVWSFGRWYKFHTPLKHGPVQDDFADLATKVAG